jgi:hypothetical protein
MNTFLRLATSFILLGAMNGFSADRPPPQYHLIDDADHTFVSPDKLHVEQYAMVSPDGYWHWQFWVFNSTHTHGCLLNREPMHDYAAGFRFSPDSRFLVRMQKTGAGYAELHLYRRSGENFIENTGPSLSEQAWQYYENVRHSLSLPEPNEHISADLVKGYDENYRWLGYHWPASRYIIVGLSSGSMDHSLWCVYDTKRDRFFVPPDLATKRAAAIPAASEATPSPRLYPLRKE